MTPKRPTTPPPGFIPLRGPSGRLYGYIDPKNMLIEVKASGAQKETIKLSDYLPSK